MSEWRPKRFWKTASAAPVEGGYGIFLDGRPVRTPAKVALTVPSIAVAEAIAAEWDAQGDLVDPANMPWTRTANAAIDKVAKQRDEVAEMIAAYGDADLLCYRASEPEALVRRQAEAWDPMLDWARNAEGMNLTVLTGVIHQPQPAATLGRIAAATRAMDAFELAAFHDLVGLSGSFVLGLAAARRARAAEELWDLSRLDEAWQEEQWGPDEEARDAAEKKRAAFLHAAEFLEALHASR